MLLPVFPSLGLSFPVCALLCHLLVSTSLPQTLSRYPPRPSHRLSLGTHQFRHLLASESLPPTLAWYPPRSYHLRLSSYYHLRHITFFDTCAWVFTSRGPLTSLMMSFLDTRSSSEDVALNDTMTTPTCKDGCVIGTPFPRSSPHPCNVAGVSRGRIPITVHLMRLHELGTLWNRSTLVCL